MIITVIGYDDFKLLTGTFGAPTYSVFAGGFAGAPQTTKVAYAFYADGLCVKITMNAAVSTAQFQIDFPSAVELQNMLAFS
jgi:hypothetical protein